MKLSEPITSKDNQKLKHARQVRDGRDENEIFIEGKRLAVEALRSRLIIKYCLLSSDILLESKLEQELTNNSIEIITVLENIFSSVADTKNSQGIVLIAEKPEHTKSDIEKNLDSASLVVLLHEANNPSNVGSVLRTAEAGGVAGIILTNGSADPFTARSIRASMGAVFRVPIWKGVELSEALMWAKDRGLVSTAADIKGERNYFDIDWKLPRLLVLGSEAHGLNDQELEQIDEKIVIAMKKETESLNLSVSAGIIIFESLRQRS